MDDAKHKSDVARLRKEALEAKKQKLEKLRATKADKEAAVAARKKDEGTGTDLKENDPTANIDDVMQSLLGDSAAAEAEDFEAQQRRFRSEKMATLASQHNVVNINIPSKETPTYERGVQTVASGTDTNGLVTPRGVLKKVHIEDVKDEHDVTTETHPEESKFIIPEMSDAEKQAIVDNRQFTDFFYKACRIVERALVLDQRMGDYDFTVDYTADESKEMGKDEVAQLVCEFYDDALCHHRAVTDITWSPKHPELVVVSYSDRLDVASEEGKEGMVLIWSYMNPKSPEFTFYCQSPVLRAFISQFNPNLVVASTYSGQIVIWDKSTANYVTTPTQRTPLSSNGHTFPVFSMDLVGTDNANALITISTDGKLRSWNLLQLVEPQDSGIDLTYPKDDKKAVNAESLAATCTSFVDGDANTCVVGSEDGCVFCVARHTGTAEKISMKFVGHEGPVTAVSCHPASGSGAVDFTGLFLSASMDWTIRLWDKKRNVPLHTLEDSSDYVYDVKWSPSHPSVFASVDGTGHLSIWNLIQEPDVPIGRKVQVSKHALNRLQWARDGKRIAVGTSHGSCYLYEVRKDVANPPQNCSSRFADFIGDLQAKLDDEAAAAVPK